MGDSRVAQVRYEALEEIERRATDVVAWFRDENATEDVPIDALELALVVGMKTYDQLREVAEVNTMVQFWEDWRNSGARGD